MPIGINTFREICMGDFEWVDLAFLCNQIDAISCCCDHLPDSARFRRLYASQKRQTPLFVKPLHDLVIDFMAVSNLSSSVVRR